MRKIVIHRPGGYERLVLEEHPDPEPGPGEVRIAVRAIGVNFADGLVRMGLYGSALRYVGWPITPGFEVAGTIDAVGPPAEPSAAGAAPLAVGDEVIALTRFGGYATRLVVPARQVRRRPSALSVVEAAAFPAAALTAWYALHELVRVHRDAGTRLLVHSAAGGVGSMLVRLGTLAGCRVTGVVGASHKVAVARSAGAEVVIDRSCEDLWRAAEAAAPDGFDVVLDASGPATLRESWRHLAPEGRLVVYGFHTALAPGRGRASLLRLARAWLRTPRFSPLTMTAENRSVMAFNFSYLFDRPAALDRGLAELLGLAAAGELRPVAVETFPLAAAAEAQRRLESGETVGKLALTVDEP